MKDINLLPEDVRNSNEMPVARPTDSGISPVAVIIAVIVLVLMVASIFIPKFYSSYLDSKADAIQQQLNSSTYNEVRRIDRELANVSQLITKKKAVISDIDNSNISISETINSIKNSAPKGCFISSISYDGNKVQMLGIVENIIIMNEFMSNLDKLQSIKRGADQSISYSKANSTDTVYQYSLTFSVGKGAK